MANEKPTWLVSVDRDRRRVYLTSPRGKIYIVNHTTKALSKNIPIYVREQLERLNLIPELKHLKRRKRK